MAKTKDINLYKVMTTKSHRAPVLPIFMTLLVLVVFGALFYSAFVFFSTTIADLSAQRDDLNRYLNSDQISLAYRESTDYERNANEMATLAGEVKNTLVALSSYPDLDVDTYTRIMELSGENLTLTSMSYDRRTGVLSFFASSEDVTSFPMFVESLRKTELFTDIQYRGFVRSNRTEIYYQEIDENGITYTEYAPVTEYAYSVQCQLVKPQPHLPDISDVETNGTNGGSNTNEGTGTGGGTG